MIYIVLNHVVLMNIWIQQVVKDYVLQNVKKLLISQVEHVYLIQEIVHLLIH